ncbi:hypothetical protein OG455_11900 [Kitasatospora sp. NBC_01287]|uniref:hypothetical protein n=1 Tax=Kitasatospora sp. NBC_01287 TaxID=2903573 RepID=UPI00225AF3A7|nr:hypothetical protein [Kitasatospora sp. NBC_01287]MCX4746219.1 hypothetical protein [Kitasatospora sp. NBC_01287]
MADLVAPPQPSAGPPPADTVLTYAQLHERQCIACPATVGLAVAGYRTVDGLTWAVAACPEHVGEAS